MQSMKCLFRNDDGTFCKRWAQRSSRFCYSHQPQALDGPGGNDWPTLHPFTRLAMPSDLFDLLRESLNALRMGTMPPAQAGAISTMAGMWLKVYDRMEYAVRLSAIQNQVLPSLVDAESAAHVERLAISTAETERAAALNAELDYIIKHGPPGLPDEAPSPEQQPPSSPAPVSVSPVSPEGRHRSGPSDEEPAA